MKRSREDQFLVSTYLKTLQAKNVTDVTSILSSADHNKQELLNDLEYTVTYWSINIFDNNYSLRTRTLHEVYDLIDYVREKTFGTKQNSFFFWNWTISMTRYILFKQSAEHKSVNPTSHTRQYVENKSVNQISQCRSTAIVMTRR